MDKKDLLKEAGIEFKELPNDGFLIDIGLLSSEKLNTVKKILGLHE